MINALVDYSWEQAFLYVNDPNRVPPGAGIDNSGFTREDVALIAWMEEGDNDGPNWIVGGQLHDARWFFLSAGCDFTGWDCQAWGESWVGSSRWAIERFGMGDEDRRRLNVVI